MRVCVCVYTYNIYIYIYKFIFGCAGSSLLHSGFFSSCGRGLLIAVPSIVEHGL